MAGAHLLPQTCCPPAMRRREQKTDASGLRSSNRPQQACCERITQPKRCQGPSGPCRGTCWLRVCAESPASPESSMWLWDANTAIVMGIGSCPRPWVHVEWTRRDQRRGEGILGHWRGGSTRWSQTRGPQKGGDGRDMTQRKVTTGRSQRSVVVLGMVLWCERAGKVGAWSPSRVSLRAA